MAEDSVGDLRPVLRGAIEELADKRRMAAGIEMCRGRERDFSGEAQMMLTGIALVPEARRFLSDALTAYWDGRRGRSASLPSLEGREVIIGGGFHALAYAAGRVRKGFPRPVVLERGTGAQVGGAFAVSLEDVFLLNSRSRPGQGGLPDQDKALNFVPGGLVQPDMVSSREYPSNADMAWVIRAGLAQYADVYTEITVTSLNSPLSRSSVRIGTTEGSFTAARVIDARGTGDPGGGPASVQGASVLTFPAFMQRMGSAFPLRGVRQMAIIGAGNSGLCAAESALGIAPGNSSVIGLDYVQRVDLYATSIDGRTCDAFRTGARGRYIRLAQYLEGNASSPSDRLRVYGANGYPVPLPDGGVIVNDRTYDMAVVCTGTFLPDLADDLTTGYSAVRLPGAPSSATVLATKAGGYQSYRIGPAASISLSAAESEAGLSPANAVAMFRLGPRTSALSAMLPGT